MKGVISVTRGGRPVRRAAPLALRTLVGLAAAFLAASALQPLRAQSPARPTITVASAITAEPASQVALLIGIGPPEAVPAKSFVRVRGLPPMAALSDGHSIAPGAWAVALTALPNLKVTLPAGASGRSEMIITLVALDGSVLAETKSSLVIAAARPVEKSQAPPPPAASMLRAGVPVPTPPEAKEPSGPAPAAGKAMTPQDKERAQRLMTRGNQQLEEGNVASARLFYEQAVDAGLPQAAMALAATFDAAELARLRVRGIEPNATQARHWYERARQLGVSEAEQRLKRLGAQ